MNNVGKFVAKMGLISILSVLPLAAQVDEGVNFATSFPFYAGGAKFPAGQYTITQTDMSTHVLRIESSDGLHSGFVDFIPTLSEHPHRNSDVTFLKHGNTDYLNRVWIEGENYGIKVDGVKAHTNVIADANAGHDSSIVSGQ